MLLVDSLLADPQPAGYVLPGPALGAGVVDLQGLQDLQQPAKGGDRTQADLGVMAVAGHGQGRHLTISQVLHAAKVPRRLEGGQSFPHHGAVREPAGGSCPPAGTSFRVTSCPDGRSARPADIVPLLPASPGCPVLVTRQRVLTARDGAIAFTRTCCGRTRPWRCSVRRLAGAASPPTCWRHKRSPGRARTCRWRCGSPGHVWLRGPAGRSVPWRIAWPTPSTGWTSWALGDLGVRTSSRVSHQERDNGADTVDRAAAAAALGLLGDAERAGHHHGGRGATAGPRTTRDRAGARAPGRRGSPGDDLTRTPTPSRPPLPRTHTTL